MIEFMLYSISEHRETEHRKSAPEFNYEAANGKTEPVKIAAFIRIS